MPEEGELVPYTEGVPLKLSKMAKGKGRASSFEGREAGLTAEVRPLNSAWSL